MTITTELDPTRGRFEMDKFDGKGDFGMWKYKLLGQLDIQGLASALDENATLYKDSEKLEEGAEPVLDPVKVAKDTRVKNLTGTCLSDMILRKVMHERTAYGMWKALERDYQTKSLPNMIDLKQQFASFKMEESKSMEENMDMFLKLVGDLASLNINVSDEDQAIQLLTSLPAQYEALVHTLKYGTGKETLTVREVTASSYSKEIELRQRGLLNKGKFSSEGLYVESRGRSSKKGDRNNNRPNKGRSKSRDYRSKSKPRYNKEQKTGCFICGKDGHWKRECPQRYNKQQGNGDSANSVSEPKQPLVLTVSTQDSKNEWVLDSGCSFHMTPQKEELFDFKEHDGGKVLMANNTHCEVKGIAKIKICNSDGREVILTDVRYMPRISSNLISYGMLEKAGCSYTGEDYKIIFYKNGEKVISGRYQDGLYYLIGDVSKAEANIGRAEPNVTDLWHSRLGHMSLANMNALVNKGYFQIKDVEDLKFCESCVLGKSHKQSFPKVKHTTKGILDYVHSDLWGSPSTPERLGGCKYFVSFIDDYSKKVWVYFLRTKDEAFERFKEWKIEVENQTGNKLKCLRTDNGLEF